MVWLVLASCRCFTNLHASVAIFIMANIPTEMTNDTHRFTKLPLLGFCAYSGTGKTTLLTQLIPLLRTAGLRIAVIKHTHHVLDLDKPGKDSYRMREAGAEQVVLASHKRIITTREINSDNPDDTNAPEATLADALANIAVEHVDLILVEGFKHERYPKIELHRPSLGKPLLHPDDPDVIAIATDDPALAIPDDLTHLDINQPEAIAAFVSQHITAVQAAQQSE